MNVRRLPRLSTAGVVGLLLISMTAGRWGGLTTSLSLLAFIWIFGFVGLATIRPRTIDLGVFRQPAVGFSVGLFTVLPLLGVLAGRGGLTSAAAFGVGLSLVAAYALGQYMAADRFDLSRALVAVLGLDLVLILSQVAAFNGFPFLSQLNALDVDSKFGAGYFIVARPSGLFLNPNDLGSFSAVVLAYAMVIDIRHRMAILSLSAVAVLASGSRGALLAIAAVVLWLLVQRYLSTRGSLLQMGRIAAVLAVAVGLLLAFGPDVLIERLQFRGGVAEDSSVTGRFDQITDLWNWVLSYPLGYWSPPQLLSGTAIDNDWTRVLVQGGLAMLLLWIAALVVLGGHLRNLGTSMAAPVLVASVLSFSQLIVGRPTGLLLFALLGYHHRMAIHQAINRRRRSPRRRETSRV